MKKGRKHIYILIFFCGVLLGASILFFVLNSGAGEAVRIDREQNERYPLVRRLLDAENKDQVNEGRILLLKRNIEEYINKQKEKEILTQASVYIRDLNNGPWMGINENDAFKPASLLKVPIMMGIFKHAEKDKSLLSQTVIATLSGELQTVQTIVPSKRALQGWQYTIEQLVEQMIIYSDNSAKDILVTNLVDIPFDQVFYDLGIDVPGIQTTEDDISVRKYASFFRILYNASYLSVEYSQKALELLEKSEFGAGLRAGVPTDIIVAHKFGEREFSDSSEKQLHDCGIVYKHKRPYLICVMTRGYNLELLSRVISFISKITYEDF